MKTYTANGTVTERLPVELTPEEAEAFDQAFRHLEPHVADDDTWPLFTGLRRIAKAWRIEKNEGAGEGRQ